jgi:hypothetical protein
MDCRSGSNSGVRVLFVLCWSQYEHKILSRSWLCISCESTSCWWLNQKQFHPPLHACADLRHNVAYTQGSVYNLRFSVFCALEYTQVSYTQNIRLKRRERPNGEECTPAYVGPTSLYRQR